eukprot:GHVR01144135.1.p1 GENE.GHVR01144135.1~~GHVR01144135.1.p1  ORF type:complete len:111 (+),score=13.52 GHVR01144135.1:173-505(+)
METKEVYAVIGNTDCTEGRGSTFVKAYAETMATAKRLGHKGYVQGSNCPIEKRTLYKPEGTNGWHGPVKVEMPTVQDAKVQVEIDKRQAVLDKATALGLSAEDLTLLKTA